MNDDVPHLRDDDEHRRVDLRSEFSGKQRSRC